MHKQEHMVKDNIDGFRTYYFYHSFKTSLRHALEHIDRNKHKSYTLYRKNNSSSGDKWVKVHC